MTGTGLGKKYRTVLVLIVVIIIIVVVATYTLQPAEVGITAAEAKSIADDIAYSLRDDAVLILMQSTSKMVDNGTYSEWHLLYVVPNAYGSWHHYNSEGIFITVRTRGENTHRIETARFRGYDISDFNIDSNQAYEIALSNDTVRNFISENNPQGPSYVLMKDRVNNTYCDLMWNYEIPEEEIPTEYYQNTSYPDPPRVSLGINIDAITGDVVQVFIYNPLDEYSSRA